jgi:translocation and assembly module TamA
MFFSRPSRLSLVVAMILAAASFNPRPSRADERWDSSAYKDWTISSVKIRGLEEKIADELQKGLAINLKSGFLGSKKPTFYPQILDEDIRRARLFLARRGYPYASIKAQFEPDARSRAVGIILEVERGPAVRVASVTLAGIPAGVEKEAAKAVSVAPDSVFSEAAVKGSVQSLASVLAKAGYARARVDSRIDWRDSTNVNVEFDAAPGSIYWFGDIEITGADDDLVPLARRVVDARRGERYDPAALEESQKNLRVLGLFRQIRLETKESGPDSLDVVVDLSMRESQSIETGVRYWTDEKLDVGVRWTHRNLFKGGRGGQAYMSASSVLQRIEFSAWWPAVVFARSRLLATAGVRRESEESYEETSSGIDAALSYDWQIGTTTRWDINLSNVVVTEKTPDPNAIFDQDGILAALGLSWERDRSDDPIVATRGTVTRLEVEWAPNFELSDYHFIRVEPSISAYTALPGVHSGVLAVRLVVGFADPIGASVDLLPSRRFYSGGASSMRGFNRRKLGPLDSAGAPLGGEALFEGSMELRVPLFWRLRGAWFVDSGQVWETIDDMTADNIEFATGPGIWFNTVIGPLRSDLAYRLTNYQSTEPRWVFHFSIGPAF